MPFQNFSKLHILCETNFHSTSNQLPKVEFSVVCTKFNGTFQYNDGAKFDQY